MEPELLAHHFAEAERVDKAIDYWGKAGQRCQAQSANHEAIHHYHRGLEQVSKLPESSQRDGLELSFQLPLGVSLLAARGYANAEAGTVLDRALELGGRVADPATLFYILWGSWARHLVRSDLHICREYIQRILDHAERQVDSSWLCEAHFVPEVVNFYAGDFAASCRHAEEAIARFDPESCLTHAQGTGQDVRSGVLSFHGMSLWPLGHVDRALQQARDVVAVSRTLKHPMSLGFAFHHGGWVLFFARLWEELLSLAEECYRLATEQGLVLWESSALYHRGLCYLHLGQLDKGLQQMHEGCERFTGTGARCAVPLYLTMLGEGYRRAGDFRQALAWIERSFQWAEDTDDQNFYLAETHRVKGDILLALDASNASDVEACYRHAVEIARSQAALSFELRAAMGLFRLSQLTGQTEVERRELQQVYGRFREGFSTPDLIEARQLLAGTSVE